LADAERIKSPKRSKISWGDPGVSSKFMKTRDFPGGIDDGESYHSPIEKKNANQKGRCTSEKGGNAKTRAREVILATKNQRINPV